MALLRRFEAKTLVLFLGLALLSCGAYAIRGVNPPPGNVVFDVTKFGARLDGKLNCAAAFMEAWKKACASTKNSTVLIPGGVYVTSEVKFHGPCANKMTLDVQGSVLADSDGDNYPGHVWFSVQSIDGLEIKGKGMFDAQDKIVWEYSPCADKSCESSKFTSSFRFRRVRNVNIDGMTSRNSMGSNIKIENSSNMTIQNVHLFSPMDCSKQYLPLDCSKTAAIDVTQSKGVKLVSGHIETGGHCTHGDVGTDFSFESCIHDS